MTQTVPPIPRRVIHSIPSPSHPHPIPIPHQLSTKMAEEEGVVVVRLRYDRNRLACERCRSLRRRCLGGEPCPWCEAKGQACVYVPGIRPGRKTPNPTLLDLNPVHKPRRRRETNNKKQNPVTRSARASRGSRSLSPLPRCRFRTRSRSPRRRRARRRSGGGGVSGASRSRRSDQNPAVGVLGGGFLLGPGVLDSRLFSSRALPALAARFRAGGGLGRNRARHPDAGGRRRRRRRIPRAVVVAAQVPGAPDRQDSRDVCRDRGRGGGE